jgi:hypothetical protein
VDQTKSTARPMTSEELAAAGLSPNRDEVHGSEDIHVRESDLGNASAHDSETREDGEVRSEGEDLGDAEADPRISLQRNDQNPCLPRLFLVNRRLLQI